MPRGSAPGERRGGRQKGTPNRRTVARQELADSAIEEGLSPLEMMLSTARALFQEGTIESMVAACAICKDAAPYCHPRLSAVSAAINATTDPLAELMERIADQGSGLIHDRR